MTIYAINTTEYYPKKSRPFLASLKLKKKKLNIEVVYDITD